MRQAMRRVFGGERGRWLIAALVSLAALACMRALQPATFYDNDDLNIAWALAGYRSGTPSFSHPFLNFLTAAFVSALYAVLPRAPWWLVVQSAGLLFGMTAFGASLLKIAADKRLPVWLPACVYGLFLAGVFFYPAVLVTFTLTSAVLGMGAVALALAVADADAIKTQRAYLGLCAALLVMSFLIRQSSGLCAACFVFAALGYRYLSARLCGDRAAAKRALVTAGALALCAALLTAANTFGRSALQPAGFLEFEEARAAYIDYPHDAYHENPALYASVGWDETLTGLADAWFFMDARIDAASLHALSEGSAFSQLGVLARLQNGVSVLVTFLGKYPIGVYLCLLCGGVLLGNVAAFLAAWRRAWPKLLLCGCLYLGAGALLGYLCYAGRMNLRTLMAVVYPLLAGGAATALLLLPDGAAWRKASPCPGRARRVLCGAAAAAVFCAMLLPAYRTARTVYSYDSAEALAAARGLADYAMAHPGNVYIRDVYAANNFDAVTVYPDEKPVNLMDWGGCDMYTSARAAQMAKNGLTGPYADVFLQDNVYYVCEKDGVYSAMLSDYMAARYGAGATVCDELSGGLAVIKFSTGEQ